MRSRSNSLSGINALIANLQRNMALPVPPSMSAKERAMELFYEAMDEPNLERARKLVMQAKELDPENLNVQLMCIELGTLPLEKRIEELRGIVSLAEKQLGKKAFTQMVPHFWGVLETRPYMRAREALGLALSKAGRLEEAAVEFFEMLRLNENDNQGIRHQLLPLLLEQSRLEESRSLIKRYARDCEWNVVFAWGAVLLCSLEGKQAQAVKALSSARKQNPHIEAYLKGHRKVRKQTPDSYSPGSKEEAECFAECVISAWKAHPQALAWLEAQPKAGT